VTSNLLEGLSIVKSQQRHCPTNQDENEIQTTEITKMTKEHEKNTMKHNGFDIL
jgi:hypothetical protein